MRWKRGQSCSFRNSRLSTEVDAEVHLLRIGSRQLWRSPPIISLRSRERELLTIAISANSDPLWENFDLLDLRRFIYRSSARSPSLFGVQREINERQSVVFETSHGSERFIRRFNFLEDQLTAGLSRVDLFKRKRKKNILLKSNHNTFLFL